MAFDNACDFEKVVSKEIRKMLSDSKECRDKGQKPLIVTVSRRMPHVLYWYRECLASDEEKQLIDELEIITEIALPFINFIKETNYKIFLLDDVIRTGRTFKYIKKLIKYFSEDDVKTYVIFLKENSLSFKSIAEIDYGLLYNESDFNKIRDFISTIIAVTLPIDVTYPLIYLADSTLDLNFDDFKKQFKDPKSTDIENYDVEITGKSNITVKNGNVLATGAINQSYTSLLISELSGSLNNDFAKIRVYKRFDEFIVVPYAPNILSDSQLEDPELFQNPVYAEAWKLTLQSIDHELLKTYNPFDDGIEKKEAVSNRCFRSLVCVANYLYSLSSFNRVVKGNTGFDFPEFKLEQGDLALIIGKELAGKIYQIVKTILDERLESPRIHQKLKISSTLIPEIHEEEYTISKYMSIEGSDLDKNLIAIFKNARMNEEFPAFFPEDLEYSIEGVMETFESLEKTLFINDLTQKVKLYQWIDKKIDECFIVSRYAYAYDESYNRYWRRFFRMTSINLD